MKEVISQYRDVATQGTWEAGYECFEGLDLLLLPDEQETETDIDIQELKKLSLLENPLQLKEKTAQQDFFALSENFVWQGVTWPEEIVKQAKATRESGATKYMQQLEIQKMQTGKLRIEQLEEYGEPESLFQWKYATHSLQNFSLEVCPWKTGAIAPVRYDKEYFMQPDPILGY